MLYAIAVFAPLLGSLVAGLFGRQLGDRASQAVTVLCMAVATFAGVASFVPFLAGLAVGLIAPRRGWRLRHTLPAVLIMTLAGWGVPLYWPAVEPGQPVGATARVIAALAGLPAYAFTGVLVTLLVAVLQAVVGLWLGRAFTPRIPSR